MPLRIGSDPAEYDQRLLKSSAYAVELGLVTPESGETRDVRWMDPELRTWHGFSRFCVEQLRIVDQRKRIVSLRLNWLQRRIWAIELKARRAGRRAWFIILKYRRGGVTTLQQALNYWQIWRQEHQECATFAHRQDDTRKIFRMVDRFYRNQPVSQRHEKTQAKTLWIEFPTWDGFYSSQTAGSAGAGRGLGMSRLHLSEAAFYSDLDGLHTGLHDTIAEVEGSAYVIESTPNGRVGKGQDFYEFYQAAQRGESEFIPIFVAWHMDPANQLSLLEPDELGKLSEEEQQLQVKHALSLEQVKWWRTKRRGLVAKGGRSDIIHQEHPSDDNTCLAAGERIGSNVGIVPIEDVSVGAESDHGHVLAKVCNGVQDIIQLQTRHGYRLRCTPDHRIRSADESGFFVAASESTGVVVRLQPPLLTTTLYRYEWEDFGGVHMSLTIDERWGRLLGYYMGDGSFYGTTLAFAFCRRDPDVVEEIANLVEQLFGHPDIRYLSPGGGQIRIGRKAFIPLFERLGIVTSRGDVLFDEHGHPTTRTHYRRRVCVPDAIWRSPRSVVREFLRALFEADGWVKKDGRCVKFFTKYEQFCRDIQLLLLSLEVVSKVICSPKTVGEKHYDGWELYFSPDQTKAFHAAVGFISTRKLERAACFQDKTGGQHGRPNAFTDVVQSVDDAGRAEVWDLSIEGEPVFGASGILVHNCFLLSIAGYYDRDLIANMEAKTRDPIAVEENGRLRIYEWPTGEDGYSIGCDVGEGVGADDSTAYVINASTGATAAVWASNQMPPDEFGRMVLGDAISGLGYRYRNESSDQPAFITVERNNHGHATLAGLLKMAEYPRDRVYHHVDPTKRTREGRDMMPEQEKKAGWPHTQVSHVQLTNVIGRVLREGEPEIADAPTMTSIREVGIGVSGAEFTGRDLAVGVGLAVIGLPYATDKPQWAYIGGERVQL